MSAHDPMAERLSEYLDGDLERAEREALEAHLATCAECRTRLAELRELVAAARGLPDRAPERDLWPELERRLVPASPASTDRAARRERRWPLLAAFAAGALASLGAVLASGRDAPPAERVARGEPWLLLLHEPQGHGADLTDEEHAAIVARYSAWARELGARCAGGEELAPEGAVLRVGAEPRPLADGPRVGGYFLLEVAGEEEALALARTCPHLDEGGWIEVRRIRGH